MYPEVKNYGEVDPESFEEYYERWPSYLNTIPRDIVKEWIYRHWDDFQIWIPLEPHKWTYELKEFTNDEILSIDHINNWIETLHKEGVEYINGTRKGFAGSYVVNNGTFPSPIIVGENFGSLLHPSVPESFNWHMKEPFQLIEGTRRLGSLFGMIDAKHHNLQDRHEVWVVVKFIK